MENALKSENEKGVVVNQKPPRAVCERKFSMFSLRELVESKLLAGENQQKQKSIVENAVM